MDDRPIGMFDSGFGGLTVARALIDLLPSEDLVYVGDTARYPYGPKSQDEVRQYASQITRKLVDEHDVKLVVVACNTATAAALELLRYDYDVPLVGVIDPGVRALLSVTRTGRVGVIGTVGAIGSGAYQRAVQARRSLTSAGLPVQLTSTACPGFVELVEQGRVRGQEALALAERLLAPGCRRQGGLAPARVYPLPLPGAHNRGSDGARGGAGQFGGRDGLRSP